MLKKSEYIFEMFINSFRYEPETGAIYYTYRLEDKEAKIGAVRIGTGHLYVRIRYRRSRYEVLAHRLAWRLVYGKWPEGKVIHKNGLKCDNRIENLILEKEANRSKQNV